ncbi:unnamed protein product [Rotaria magnacalcarata]|uniref:MULE transposase domain-containing protein n=1 Tax=Rotaria magnacalcarata TaxID=392030 RepID=A0A816LER9_9BILA|nr:unnamed protein product [Rotaria magnacalcarata]CAF4339414.1 unnamed protein product [Rotaria magnacalcarata]
MPASAMANLPTARSMREYLLPSMTSVRNILFLQSLLYYHRKVGVPTLPTSIDFDVPLQFTVTVDKQPFLICDLKQNGTKKFILFASERQLGLLFNSELLFMDGTFDVSPAQFKQLYTIHAIKHDQVYACVFGLLGSKKSHTYKNLFQELKSIAAKMNLRFDPKMIMSDFETGLIRAIQQEFPQAEHRGCAFHHMQAMYRHVGHCGLTAVYKEQGVPRDVLRRLFSLCLMPKDTIEGHYQRLLHSIKKYKPKNIREKLVEFFTYYHDQWLAKVGVDMFCVSDLRIRTNNECETFHHALAKKVKQHHPSIWWLITCLSQQEFAQYHRILAAAGGQPQKRRCSKSSVKIQNRIDTLHDLFNTGVISADELLTGLTFVIAKKNDFFYFGWAVSTCLVHNLHVTL